MAVRAWWGHVIDESEEYPEPVLGLRGAGDLRRTRNLYIPPETEDRDVETIYRSLGDKPPFAGIWELAEYLATVCFRIWCESYWTQHVDEDAAILRLTCSLIAPARSYSVAAPLVLVSHESIELDLGTEPPRLMKVSSRPTRMDDVSGVLTVELTAQVEAATEYGAIQRLEHAMEALLGASLALGLTKLRTRIPGEPPDIQVNISPCDEGERFFLNPQLASAVTTIMFSASDLTDVESSRLEKGGFQDAFAGRFETLQRVMSVPSGRTSELLNAARLHLLSGSTADGGMAILLSLLSMEAVLLERSASESILARLSEAVAYRIGTSARARADLRKELRELYKLRSEYVHTGTIVRNQEQVWRAQELCAQVLRREMTEIET